MQIEFTYAPEDFRELTRVHAKATRGGHRFGRGAIGWIVLIVAAVILLAVLRQSGAPPARARPAVTPSSAGTDDWSYVSPVIGLVIFAGVFVLIRFAQRRAYSKAASTQRPQTLIVEPHEMICYNGPITSRYEWSAFDKLVETKTAFFWIFTGNSWIIIPKRSLPGPEIQTSLRHVLETNVRPVTGAFPVIPLGSESSPDPSL